MKIRAGKFCNCRNGPAAGGVRGRVEDGRKTERGEVLATVAARSPEAAERVLRDGDARALARTGRSRTACKVMCKACGQKPYTTTPQSFIGPRQGTGEGTEHIHTDLVPEVV